VANVPKIDVPRCLGLGIFASWMDSISLLIGEFKTRKTWRVFLDGRPPQLFSEDSIWACTVGAGKYVIFQDLYQRARLAGEPERWCRFEEWDGIGPKNAKALPEGHIVVSNYEALYGKIESDFYRISFHDWKMVKLNVNIEGNTWSDFRTTRDGKEMIFSTFEVCNKIGVIENLFK